MKRTWRVRLQLVHVAELRLDVLRHNRKLRHDGNHLLLDVSIRTVAEREDVLLTLDLQEAVDAQKTALIHRLTCRERSNKYLNKCFSSIS